MLKRERLSASLAKRPSLDLLQQRNILPDSARLSLSRERLASSFPVRPPVEQLLEQHILHPTDEKAEQLAKRKRLEGFLVARPSLEQVEKHLIKGVASSHHANRRQSLDAQLSAGLEGLGGEPTAPHALDSVAPTLDDALGGDSMRLEDEMES